MFSLVKEELIIKFLSNYNIDYNLLTIYEKSNVVILSNILFILFWFVVIYIFYRFICKLLGL